MAAPTTVTLPLQPLTSRPRPPSYPYSINYDRPFVIVHLSGRCSSITPLFRFEKLCIWSQNFCACSGSPRRGLVMGYHDDIDEEEDDEDDDEQEERSLDLLIRFVENVFRKVSRKARKAVKSVLPVPISTKLVDFAVNGTIILTFLWILKAFLEVICTLGSMVFMSILIIRGIWSGISHFQENRSNRTDDGEFQSWSRTRPAF